MKKFGGLVINIFLLPCLTVAVAALLCLNPDQAFGQNIGNWHKSIISPPQGNTESITSGVYGPFSSYYRPTLLLGSEICRLAKNTYESFQVICFPMMTTSGMRLAETDEAKNIQAQLLAVNGPNGQPMPELTIFLPLADMEQKFFSQDITKRLLRDESLFDYPCSLTYQSDEQPPIKEDWSCSSFLNYFDKYTGQHKLYRELRVRPTTLRSTPKNTNAARSKNLAWFIFFKKLQGHKKFNINLGLDEDLTIELTLDLTDYDKWIDSLLAIHQGDESSQYFENINVPETIHGPFSSSSCEVNRYVKPVEHEHHKQLYEDIFLITCDKNYLSVDEMPTADKVLPKWLYEIFNFRTFEGSASHSPLPDNSDIHMHLGFQGLTAPFGPLPSGGISISSFLNTLFVSTHIRYPLPQMEPILFNSRIVRDTLNDFGKLKTPCKVSFIVDGEPTGSENLKCDLSYQRTGSGITIDTEVDYGLAWCLQFGDKACAKAALTKATSFLKDIKKENKEIIMEIQFEEGETISTSFDLDDFDFNGISLFLKRVESLE